MDNKQVQDILKFAIIGFIIIDAIMLYFSVIIPNLEYYYYKYNIEEYTIVDADVFNSHKVILLPGKFEPLLWYRKNMVKYTINGVEYTKKTYAYPEVTEKEQIKIAVKITNNTSTKRCVAYHWDKNQRIHFNIEFIVIVVLIILFCLNNYFLHKKEKKRKYNEKTFLMKQEKNFNEQILDKQSYILGHIPQCSVAEKVLQELIENFVREELKCNNGTLWIITNYSNSKAMLDILNLLPLIQQDKYYDYIDKMHEQGLPENYYVLAKNDENYYCCCGENEWLYMYSKGVGITHTKYATIYDYIIEQIDKR